MLSLSLSLSLYIYIYFNLPPHPSHTLSGPTLNTRMADVNPAPPAPWSKGWSLPRNEALEGFGPREGKYKDLATGTGPQSRGKKVNCTESGDFQYETK